MEIKTILCSVDFSSISARVLRLAIEASRLFNSRLVLHHNVDPPLPSEIPSLQMFMDKVLADQGLQRLSSKQEAAIKIAGAGVTTAAGVPESLAVACRRSGALLSWRSDDRVLWLVQICTWTPLPVRSPLIRGSRAATREARERCRCCQRLHSPRRVPRRRPDAPSPCTPTVPDG